MVASTLLAFYILFISISTIISVFYLVVFGSHYKEKFYIDLIFLGLCNICFFKAFIAGRGSELLSHTYQNVDVNNIKKVDSLFRTVFHINDKTMPYMMYIIIGVAILTILLGVLSFNIKVCKKNNGKPYFLGDFIKYPVALYVSAKMYYFFFWIVTTYFEFDGAIASSRDFGQYKQMMFGAKIFVIALFVIHMINYIKMDFLNHYINKLKHHIAKKRNWAYFQKNKDKLTPEEIQIAMNQLEKEGKVIHTDLR